MLTERVGDNNVYNQTFKNEKVEKEANASGIEKNPIKELSRIFREGSFIHQLSYLFFKEEKTEKQMAARNRQNFETNGYHYQKHDLALVFYEQS